MLSPHDDLVVGVYDRDGRVASAIAERFRSVIQHPLGPSSDQSAEQYLADKELFLSSATDVVMVADDPEAVSISPAALRRVLSGTIGSIYAVAKLDLDPLLRMGTADEWGMLSLAEQTGRFVRTGDPSVEKAVEHRQERADVQSHSAQN